MIDISKIIKDKLIKNGGMVKLSMLKGDKTFCVKLKNDGVLVDTLHSEPFLAWEVFEKAVEILEQEGGNAL